MIPLHNAVLCACGMILDMREIRGERCPGCACQGQLLSLARILSPNSELGTITYVFTGRDDPDATTGLG